MRLSRLQWLVLAATSALLSFLCVSRVGYMMWNNLRIARTVYVGEPSTRPSPDVESPRPRKPATSEDLEGLTPRERRRRIVEQLREPTEITKRNPWAIRKHWTERFHDHEYEWEEMAPWLFSAVLFAGLSAFLVITAREKAPPPVPGPSRGAG